MSRMDEETPVFEQLTLSNFTALKTFNNYNIIITNISRKNECGSGFFVANFRVNLTGSSREFYVAFEHFEKFRKSHFEHFQREIDYLFPRRLL